MPGIYVLALQVSKVWMAGTSPGMTIQLLSCGGCCGMGQNVEGQGGASNLMDLRTIS